ncbi:MAG: divergent polysaccharide deacetylase family protein [Thermovirgaceae bacterium]
MTERRKYLLQLLRVFLVICIILPAFSLRVDSAAGVESGGIPIAILIDDLGYSREAAKALSRLPMPVTWAIIPYKSHSLWTADLAREKGIPFLTHLPMQAEIDPQNGPYLVGVGMQQERIRQIVRNALWSLPGTSGLNNHRGSKATSDPVVMDAVVDEIKVEGLLLVDSRTSSKSVAYSVAKTRGIPAGQNRIFLDHEANAEYMWSRFYELRNIARKNGGAIGICHARPETIPFLFALYESAPPDVQFVTVPEYLSRISHGNEEE